MRLSDDKLPRLSFRLSLVRARVSKGRRVAAWRSLRRGISGARPANPVSSRFSTCSRCFDHHRTPLSAPSPRARPTSCPSSPLPPPQHRSPFARSGLALPRRSFAARRTKRPLPRPPLPGRRVLRQTSDSARARTTSSRQCVFASPWRRLRQRQARVVDPKEADRTP